MRMTIFGIITLQIIFTIQDLFFPSELWNMHGNFAIAAKLSLAIALIGIIFYCLRAIAKQ